MIELRDEHYEKLIVEVEDVAETIARLQVEIAAHLNVDAKA